MVSVHGLHTGAPQNPAHSSAISPGPLIVPCIDQVLVPLGCPCMGWLGWFSSALFSHLPNSRDQTWSHGYGKENHLRSSLGSGSTVILYQSQLQDGLTFRERKAESTSTVTRIVELLNKGSDTLGVTKPVRRSTQQAIIALKLVSLIATTTRLEKQETVFHSC